MPHSDFRARPFTGLTEFTTTILNQSLTTTICRHTKHVNGQLIFSYYEIRPTLESPRRKLVKQIRGQS